jgi:YfiH family protein
MIRRSFNGIQWLEFELFQPFPCLKHGIFLRHGGLSKGLFASLNLSLGVGDNPEHVRANLNKIQALLNVSDLCWSSQIHGKTVVSVEEEWQNGRVKCDGMMTRHRDKGLMIHHADCQAAIFYDPLHHVLANVHCGWRGSALNIYSETIKKMHALYGTKPEDLYIGISPSLGPGHAEFINYKTELPELFWKFQIKPFYFDFWAISVDQLLDCGLQKQNIQIAGICTYAHPQDYFSYRYCKIRGGNATVAILL